MVPLSVASASAVAVLINFDQNVVASRGLNLRRASSANIDTAESSSSVDAVDISASRALRADVDLTQCYKDMVSVADERDMLTKDAYFFFGDIMSNQWFSDNGIKDYTDLPFDMRFAFVTLACQCKNLATIDDHSCTFTCPADINNTGLVDTSDLLAFLVFFGTECP